MNPSLYWVDMVSWPPCWAPSTVIHHQGEFLCTICRWIWLYYLNPVSWILYGQVTSQLGDVTSTFVNVRSPSPHT